MKTALMAYQASSFPGRTIVRYVPAVKRKVCVWTALRPGYSYQTSCKELSLYRPQGTLCSYCGGRVRVKKGNVSGRGI